MDAGADNFPKARLESEAGCSANEGFQRQLCAGWVPGWWRISFIFAFSKGGGDKPIERRKLSWTSKAKIGSLEKANHRPGGGQVANSWRIIDNWIGFD